MILSIYHRIKFVNNFYKTMGKGFKIFLLCLKYMPGKIKKQSIGPAEKSEEGVFRHSYLDFRKGYVERKEVLGLMWRQRGKVEWTRAKEKQQRQEGARRPISKT